MEISKGLDYLKRTASFIGRTLLLVIVIRYFIFMPGRVHGVSMEPTFFNAAAFFVDKLHYSVATPQRFEIVQALDPTNPQKLLIKRVIGLPGDTIIFGSDDRVYIKDTTGKKFELDEQYLYPYMVTRERPGKFAVVEIPQDHYFIMGDNRLASRDSRDFGPVHRKYINGLVIQLSRGNVPETLR